MKLSWLFLLLFVFFMSVRCDATVQTRPEIRGAWIHNYGPFDWEDAMKKLADAGFNTVFVRVARGANAIYPSQVLPRDDWAAASPDDEFQKALDAAHRNGLEFHAWKVCFSAAGAALQKGETKTFYDRLAAEDRLVRDMEGKQAPFLNPGDPRNQELELQVLREMTEKYDVDGVHLDYIRYTETPHYDFDYGEVSKREFEKKIGVRVGNWPTDVISGQQKWNYENWERENIDDLVERVYIQTKALKPRVQVSAAVWRAHRYNRATIKQDWVFWAKNGWLDFVVPMDYSKENTRFHDDVKSQIPNAAGRVLFVAGIGSYQHEMPETTLQQIEIARKEGTDGYALFDYRPEKYDALLAQLRNQPRSPGLPFRAPKITWTVGTGLERKDAPTAYSVGSPLGVRARFAKSAQPLPTILDVRAELHSLDGGAPHALDVPVSSKNGELGWRFPVPPGRWRFALSGRDRETGGTVEVRGPIFEGMTAEKIAELRSREKPPVVEGDGRRIAIYSGGQADSGLLGVLQTAPGLNPYLFHQLKPSHWQKAEVLLLPQLRDVAELSPPVVRDLRDWVARGGIILLTHDAVGFRWHQRIFSEIGQGNAISKTRDVEVLANEFGLTPGTWQHEYPDHVTITPGPNGKIIARNKDGAPLLVGGSFGKGKVFLYGSLLGYAPSGVLGANETQLLLKIANTQ